MGQTPLARVARPPERESFHLGRARAAYIRGEITLERFEELAGHVLRGGHLSEDLEPRGSDVPDDVGAAGAFSFGPPGSVIAEPFGRGSYR